jgi:hypothetical protein
MKIDFFNIILFMFCSFYLRGANNENTSGSENPRVQWMKGKYGLMVHWIAPGPPPQYGTYIKDLNEAVNGFKIDEFMADFDKTGAEWLIFTIGQNRGYYSSPNSVIDSLAGPGHTSHRDLVLEIAKALKQRGKKFIAYLPCEVRGNSSMQKGFGWNTQPGTDQAQFQDKYLRAIREWAVRYGEYLDGWWFDGCYSWDAFPNKYMKWGKWYEATRAGNKNVVLAFNPGLASEGENIKPILPEHDYLAGEIIVLINGKIRLGRVNEDPKALFMPETAYVKGTKCLYHALVPIDAYWWHKSPWPAASWANVPFNTKLPEQQEEMEKPIYEDNNLFKFVNDLTKVGGAVTLNVGIFQEGNLGEETIQQFIRLKKSFHK